MKFQVKIHWHVIDAGIRHVYIKPRSPKLNGKVERSHRTDKEEFFHLLQYTDDVNLNEKFEAWENFYYFSRPHGAFNGKIPYEALKCTLAFCQYCPEIMSYYKLNINSILTVLKLAQ